MTANFELYAITDQPSSRGRTDEQVAKGLLAGGATVLQYRAKKASAREQLKTAITLRAMSREKGVPLVINDRIDLAVACQADGVHLGQEDLPISAARLMVGRDMLVGISTHTLDQALRAEADGADYIGFGPVYATQTKENNVAPVGIEALAKVAGRIRIPVVAIGGIKEHCLGEIASAKVRCIAVVTALTGAEDVARATKSMKEKWQAVLREMNLKSAKKVSFI